MHIKKESECLLPQTLFQRLGRRVNQKIGISVSSPVSKGLVFAVRLQSINVA